MMNHIDRLLEWLADSGWHSSEYVKTKLSLSEDEFKKIISLLYEEGFVSKDRDNLRITQRGLKFINLPSLVT